MIKKSLILVFLILICSCNNNELGKNKEVGKSSISKSFKKDLKSNQSNFNNNISDFIDEGDFNILYKQSKFEKKIPTLMFHYIREMPKDTKDKVGYALSVSPKRFEEILNFLKINNITPITFLELKDVIDGKKELPQKPIILTFDDGYVSHYNYAHKMLKKYNMKGVFFIVTDFVSNDQNYVNWSQLKEMSEYNHEIGSHTKSHINLQKAKYKSVYEQILQSKKVLEKNLGKRIISFCYPYGRYNSRVTKLVSNHYLFARTTNKGEKISLKNRVFIPTIDMLPTTDINFLGNEGLWR